MMLDKVASRGHNRTYQQQYFDVMDMWFFCQYLYTRHTQSSKSCITAIANVVL